MNLRLVRKKIKSVRNVRKITKAMQLVSAIKMKKAQQAEIEGRPYRDELTRIIDNVTARIDTTTSLLLSKTNQEAEKDLIIFVSSNKGLAGAFNVNLFRYLIKSEIDFKKTDFITLGGKGAQFVTRMGGHIVADYSQTSALTEVSALFSYALDQFMQGKYRTISVVYNQFISTLRSEVRQLRLLPIQIEKKESIKTDTEYVIEPEPAQIIDALLRSFTEEKIRGAVISSEAVEHSARMMAMKTATDNASDVISTLTSIGNKLRQTKITNELLDMVTAKESVEQK